MRWKTERMMRVREDDKGGKRVTQDRARYD